MTSSTPTRLLADHRVNWGAFFLTWVWAIANCSFDRVTGILLLLCFTPHVGFISALALMFYCGLTGHKRARMNREWKDEVHYARVQRRWAFVGVIQFALALLCVGLFPLFVEK